MGTYRGKMVNEIKKNKPLCRIKQEENVKYKPKAAKAWTSIKAFLLQWRKVSVSG